MIIELIKMSYDIIINNGKVVNGAGNPWFYADIGIKNGIKKLKKISLT